MKRLAILFTVTLLVLKSSLVLAQNATAPTTQPSVPQRPAVLVLPFEMLGEEDRYTWIGRGVQQNLQADLGRSGMVDVVGKIVITTAGQAAWPADFEPQKLTDEQAIKMAEQANATTVIYGSYSMVFPDVRITGKVVDVGTGKVLNFLKANG